MKKSEIMSWVKSIGLALIIAFVCRTFLFTPSLVQGESMMPTLKDNERMVVNKIGYSLQGLDRFTIIVFHGNEGHDLVKRVIGLPGDTIEYKNDVLYVNGKAVAEPYLDEYKKQLSGGQLTPDFTLEEITGKKTVPEGYVFVLGDNRQVSKDSRAFGFVSEKQIVGKGSMVFWPLQHVRAL
ncbi:signal peptidase I [Bacillus sp. FJAT-53711]|uniref:Signal peptidase I n=1 Tax=Bacillus yunxiaonensis TaxID=3127665 RepID=A0ABU8FRC0_9BACI